VTEQQEHLKNLLEQRNNLEQQMNQNRELFWKVQGAIEYLTQIGVSLPQPEAVTEVAEEA
jgi:DNA-directed RNA polymerase subunit F